jgi:hypothetical protein
MTSKLIAGTSPSGTTDASYAEVERAGIVAGISVGLSALTGEVARRHATPTPDPDPRDAGPRLPRNLLPSEPVCLVAGRLHSASRGKISGRA